MLLVGPNLVMGWSACLIFDIQWPPSSGENWDVVNVAQMFYVPDTRNKRLKLVIPKKQWIIGVENAIDEEEFDQFDEIPPFITWMTKPRVPSANETPYLRNDHHEKSGISKNQDRKRK
jgi:hypothetical protein